MAAKNIPLALRIKRESYRKISAAQDWVVKEIYNQFNSAVLHGGTAIWRCYSGKRFSEDVDFYIPKDEAKINQIFKNLEKRGFNTLKKKVSENSVYSEFEVDRINVRFEATFQKVKGHLVDYENLDGTFTSIYSLTPEEFIKEKINAYLKRLKIRDLYDIYFLIKLVTNLNDISSELKLLINNYKSPIDEQDLKTIILDGIVPSSKDMIEYLTWQNKSI